MGFVFDAGFCFCARFGLLEVVGRSIAYAWLYAGWDLWLLALALIAACLLALTRNKSLLTYVLLFRYCDLAFRNMVIRGGTIRG